MAELADLIRESNKLELKLRILYKTRTRLIDERDVMREQFCKLRQQYPDLCDEYTRESKPLLNAIQKHTTRLSNNAESMAVIRDALSVYYARMNELNANKVK